MKLSNKAATVCFAEIRLIKASMLVAWPTKVSTFHCAVVLFRPAIWLKPTRRKTIRLKLPSNNRPMNMIRQSEFTFDKM